MHERFTCIYVCAPCACLDPLGLESWMAGNHSVGSGKPSQGLCSPAPASCLEETWHTSHVFFSSEECPQSIFWPRKALSIVSTLTLYLPTSCHCLFTSFWFCSLDLEAWFLASILSLRWSVLTTTFLLSLLLPLPLYRVSGRFTKLALSSRCSCCLLLQCRDHGPARPTLTACRHWPFGITAVRSRSLLTL